MGEVKPKNYHHFADKHLLIPLEPDEGENLKCKACEKPIVGLFHGCLSCNCFLHDNCINVPRSLLHPSHPSHPLTLVATPTYPGAAFVCNACGSEGNGFSFGCASCEFDVHFRCALLPAKVKIHHLHQHELKLTFNFVHEEENAIFECDFCHGAVGNSLWRYYCAECDFGAHLDCLKVDDEEMAVPQQTAKVEGDEIDGKSGTAVEADHQQPSEETGDDAGNPFRKLTNEMLEHQLAVAQLQNQMNLTAAFASVLRHY